MAHRTNRSNLLHRSSPSAQDPSGDAALASPLRSVLCIGLGLVGLALAWRFTPLAQVATPYRVTEWARGLATAWWAPLLVVVAYTPACIIMFPRPLITLAAVVAFGAWLGLLYAMCGIVTAALATYFAGRVLRPDTIRRLAGRRLDRIQATLRRHGLAAVIALRLVPVAPFAVEGVVAGAIRIKLWHYALGTLLGMLPGALTATVFSNHIVGALEGSGTIGWWIVVAVVAATALGLVAARKWLARLS